MAAVPSNADLLRNYPANIPGATRNVIPDPAVPPGEEVVGLPLAIFRPVLNEQGALADAVKVYVGPPLRDDGSTDGDYVSIALWLNGVQLEHRQIPEPERNDPTEFTLFQSSLLDNRNNNLYYKVYRLSGSPADSEPLWVLYSAQLPGGNNVPGNDEHPLLTVTLPPELGEPPFIGKDDVDAGVPLTLDYPYAKPYDVINLQLRNERFSYTVQPGDARPYVATVTRALFQQAGGNHPAFGFSFTVVDQLNNPTDQRRWSAVVRADVDLNRQMVDMPLLREEPDDVGDDPWIIDRDTLQGRPLLVVVLPRAPVFEAGDRVEGRYISTPAGSLVPFSGTIERDGFGQFRPCVMEIANSSVIAGDQVRASFSLIRAGGPVALSKTASARVIGAGFLDLPAPRIKQSPGNLLDPVTVKDALTVVIPQYTGMDPAHKVFVTWAGTAGEGTGSSLPEDVGTVGDKEIELANSLVAFNLGQSVSVTYGVIVGAALPQTSEPLLLTVQSIQSGDLPTPSIDGNDTQDLDVAAFDGDEQLLVDPWLLQLSGQRVWLSYQGILASGATDIHIIWEGQAHSVDAGLATPAPIDWLRSLKDGSTVTISFMVNFDKVANRDTAVKFALRQYNVYTSAHVRPIIGSVKDASHQELAEGAVTIDTSLVVSGTATANRRIQLLDGVELVAGETWVDERGGWTQTLANLPLKSYSLTAKARYGTEPVSTPPRTFKVEPPLSVDRTQMNLNGFSVKIPQWPRTGEDSIGNTGTRVPTGGVPPYSYASSDPRVASVTDAGKVTGHVNGTVTIYVGDRTGTTLTYIAAVTNVFQLHISSTPLPCLQAIEWMNSIGASSTYRNGFMGDIARVYQRPAISAVWTCHMSGSYGIFYNAAYEGYGTRAIDNPNPSWCLSLL